MKIACTADWHLHNFTEFSRTLSVVFNEATNRYQEFPDNTEFHTIEMNSRLFNILNGLCDMRDYCEKEKISHVLMAGDMFHHRGTIDVSVFNSAYRVLKSFKDTGINIHAIAGNHDQVDASVVPSSSLHTLSEVIHVIEKPELFSISQIQIAAVPFSKDKKHVISAIRELEKSCDDVSQSILVTHLGLSGGKVGSGMYSMNDEFTLKDLHSTKWKYVVVGHYHQPQLLSGNTFYCGSPLQNNFGDELPYSEEYGGHNGFFVVDTNRRCEIDFVPINAPRFLTVTSESNFQEDELKGNYIRIRTKADKADKIQEKVSEILKNEPHQDVRLELEKDYVQEHRSDIGVVQSLEDTIRIYAKENCSDMDKLENLTSYGINILNETLGG